VFLAFAQRIPDPVEPARLIDNPNTTWHDVDPRLDRFDIDVSLVADDAVRRAFLQLVMEPGCETFPSLRELKDSDRQLYDDVCHQPRTDGRYRDVDLGSEYTRRSLDQLWADRKWLAAVDYWYYTEHRKELSGTVLAGPPPTLATFTDGSYQAARPVYVYAQRSHLEWNPAARQLAFELTNEDAVGPEGYLVRAGLVPLDALARRVQRTRPPVPLPLESLQP
jgi:phosphate transport system substrate-binding protein